ncbi:MAG TPA: hypothetical protein VF719_05170 [Abditibacteriaceae bacterium]
MPLVIAWLPIACYIVMLAIQEGWESVDHNVFNYVAIMIWFVGGVSAFLGTPFFFNRTWGKIEANEGCTILPIAFMTLLPISVLCMLAIMAASQKFPTLELSGAASYIVAFGPTPTAFLVWCYKKYRAKYKQ